MSAPWTQACLLWLIWYVTGGSFDSENVPETEVLRFCKVSKNQNWRFLTKSKNCPTLVSIPFREWRQGTSCMWDIGPSSVMMGACCAHHTEGFKDVKKLSTEIQNILKNTTWITMVAMVKFECQTCGCQPSSSAHRNVASFTARHSTAKLVAPLFTPKYGSGLRQKKVHNSNLTAYNGCWAKRNQTQS